MTCEMYCTKKSRAAVLQQNCTLPRTLISNRVCVQCMMLRLQTIWLSLSFYISCSSSSFFSIPENMLKVTPASDQFHWHIRRLIKLFLLFCD